MKNILFSLGKKIKLHKDKDPKISYSASLLQSGIGKCSKKFGEESTELVIAAVSQDLDSFNEEAADVLFHLLVLIEAKNARLDEILTILTQRQKMSGHIEKATRNA